MFPMVFYLRKQQILVSDKRKMFNYPSDLSRSSCSGSIERYSPSCEASEEGMHSFFIWKKKKTLCNSTHSFLSF